MRFGTLQQQVFSTLDGAYSLVTPREHFDSQITLTDFEAELAIRHFGRDNIHTGNVADNPTLSRKTFRLFPDGAPVNLNLVFPKPAKPELRLYLSRGGGFRPDGDQVWFIYLSGDDIWLGSMSELEWRAVMSDLRVDDGDSAFQELLQVPGDVTVRRIAERDAYARSRQIALAALDNAERRCEANPDHPRFLAKASGLPYVEAHHLIPMGAQAGFSVSLDVEKNIFSLCPYCHSAVHHAEPDHARPILTQLAEARGVLDDYGITIEDLHRLYAVEDID